MDTDTARLLNALNGGTTDGRILESFLLDFINGDTVVSDEDSGDSEDDIVIDEINSSCSDNEDDESGGTAAPGGVQVGIEKLLVLPEITDVAVDTDEAAEMEKINNFDCKCHDRLKENSAHQPLSCSKKLDAVMMYNTRMDMAA